MDLKTALDPIVRGEIIDDQESLIKYSRDASLFEIKPELVVYPKDTQDLENLVHFVNSHPDKNLSLTARSAGTCMSGGPLNDSIILDFTQHFNKIIDISKHQSTVQPGVYYRKFEKATLKQDLLLPCYTASKMLNTVGGMVGNNSAGEKTLNYGSTKDWVEKLKVVFSDGHQYEVKPLSKAELKDKLSQADFEGQLYRRVYDLVTTNQELLKKSQPEVSKNSAGYNLWEVWDGQTFDLTKLLVGSQGTLGLITEIKFKLITPKTHSKLLVIFLDDLTNLGQIVNRVLKFKPESFECYDDETLKVAVHHLITIKKHITITNPVRLAKLFWPEIKVRRSGKYWKLTMLAEFTGNSPEEVDRQAEAAQASLSEFKIETYITKNHFEVQKYFGIRRESFNLLRFFVKKNQSAAPFIEDIIVKPENLPAFLPKLQAILREYKMTFTIASHIGNGHFHIMPLLDVSAKDSPKIVKELSDKVYELVFKYEGSMAGEHNDGLVRAPYLKQMFGAKVYQLFEEVKQIFDPNQIFNPHKKIGVSLDYALDHLRKS